MDDTKRHVDSGFLYLVGMIIFNIIDYDKPLSPLFIVIECLVFSVVWIGVPMYVHLLSKQINLLSKNTYKPKNCLQQSDL